MQKKKISEISDEDFWDAVENTFPCIANQLESIKRWIAAGYPEDAESECEALISVCEQCRDLVKTRRAKATIR